MATHHAPGHHQIRAAPTHVRRPFLVLAALTLLAGCGGSPAEPSPAPDPGPAASATIRAVPALGAQDGLPGVVVHLPDVRQQPTDAGGLAVVTGPAGVHQLRLVHPQFVERQVSLRIPDSAAVDVSLMPAASDTREFREFAPRSLGLLKWTRDPRLLVVDHTIDFSQGSAGFTDFPVGDRALPRQQIDCLAAGVAEGLATWTAGKLRWASVDVAPVEPGTRFRTDLAPDGTIVVFSAVALRAGGRAAAYPGPEPFEISRGVPAG